MSDAHSVVDAVATLIQVAEHGASVEARVDAVVGLARHLPHDDAVKALRRIAGGDNISEVKAAATDALVIKW